MNVEYSKLSGSKQYNAAGAAWGSIKSKIEDIQKRCPAHANFYTKVNALEALRKVGKVIALSGGDVLPHEIHNMFKYDTILEDTMWGIIQSMSLEECKTTSIEPQDGVTWIDKLHELKKIADEHCLFGDLKKVIKLLSPGP